MEFLTILFILIIGIFLGFFFCYYWVLKEVVKNIENMKAVIEKATYIQFSKKN